MIYIHYKFLDEKKTSRLVKNAKLTFYVSITFLTKYLLELVY